MSQPDPLAPSPLPIVGIDVSKATLDCHLLRPGSPGRLQVANSPEGHAKLLAWLADQSGPQALVALEATGSYSLAPALALFQAGHRVAMLNPRRVLDYARSAGRRNKTDRADAEVIAQCAADRAAHQSLPLWQPLPPAQDALRELLRRQHDLEAQLQAENCREDTAAALPTLRLSIQRSIRFFKAELARLEKCTQKHLEAHAPLAADVARLQCIGGIGEKTARLLAAELPRHFKNARAAAAWLGVVPRQHTSGTSVHKGSRIGHAAPDLRARLYFPAITAIRCEPRFTVFAEGLAENGKKPKSVIIAVMHKLVRTAFALLKTGTDYDPGHQSPGPKPAAA